MWNLDHLLDESLIRHPDFFDDLVVFGSHDLGSLFNFLFAHRRHERIRETLHLAEHRVFHDLDLVAGDRIDLDLTFGGLLNRLVHLSSRLFLLELRNCFSDLFDGRHLLGDLDLLVLVDEIFDVCFFDFRSVFDFCSVFNLFGLDNLGSFRLLRSLVSGLCNHTRDMICNITGDLSDIELGGVKGVFLLADQLAYSLDRSFCRSTGSKPRDLGYISRVVLVCIWHIPFPSSFGIQNRQKQQYTSLHIGRPRHEDIMPS